MNSWCLFLFGSIIKTRLSLIYSFPFLFNEFLFTIPVFTCPPFEGPSTYDVSHQGRGVGESVYICFTKGGGRTRGDLSYKILLRQKGLKRYPLFSMFTEGVCFYFSWLSSNWPVKWWFISGGRRQMDKQDKQPKLPSSPQCLLLGLTFLERVR